MSSSQLAIVQTYKVQTNGNSTASKAKKPSHGSHSISVYCNNTSANYCNIFAYLRITYNTSGACLNLPENVISEIIRGLKIHGCWPCGWRVRMCSVTS